MQNPPTCTSSDHTLSFIASKRIHPTLGKNATAFFLILGFPHIKVPDKAGLFFCITAQIPATPGSEPVGGIDSAAQSKLSSRNLLAAPARRGPPGNQAVVRRARHPDLKVRLSPRAERSWAKLSPAGQEAADGR